LDQIADEQCHHRQVDHDRDARLPTEKLPAVRKHEADEDELKQIEKRARDIVAEAAQFAQDCPEPDPSELWTDVLAEA